MILANLDMLAGFHWCVLKSSFIAISAECQITQMLAWVLEPLTQDSLYSL